MPARSVTLPLITWLAAAAALRRLNSAEGAPSGLPLAPFNAQLNVSRTIQALTTVEMAHTAARTTLEASHAMRDQNDALVPVFDPNGNRQNGQYYLDDVAKVNADLSTMHTAPVTQSIDLSLDDLVYCGARRTPELLPALMPLLDEASTLSDAAAAWLVTYDAALTRAAARVVPASTTTVPETAPVG